MDQKLLDLTEKIYAEGVEKGEARAAELVHEADKKAAVIIAGAQKEAEALKARAAAEADEFKKKAESEIRLACLQSISTLRQEITGIILAKTVDERIKTILDDKTLLFDVIKIMAQKWDLKSSEAPGLEVLLPEDKRKDLENAFKSEAVKELLKGITINFSSGIKGGFRISTLDHGFRINFSDQDFIEFFSQYLRPKIRDFIFNG